MFKEISIKMKLMLIALFTIIFVSSAIVYQAISSINEVSQKNISDYEKEAYAKKEEELKNYVSLAMKTVESYHKRTAIDKIEKEVEADLKKQTDFLFSILNSEYEKLKDTLSPEALKFRLKSIVEATRYGKTGYFWINDYDAIIVMHPIKPALNGKNLVDLKIRLGRKYLKYLERLLKIKVKVLLIITGQSQVLISL